MNYFAHALNHLNRPYFVAGTGIPDWLSVVDRKVRFRPHHLEPFADASGSIAAEVAAGALQHLHDDGWFHATRGFAEVTTELTHLFRSRLGADDKYHCGFLGHVGMELLLDGLLIERFPDEFEEYWRVLAGLDSQAVEIAVNLVGRQPTNRLAWFIDLFRREQFLRCYLDSHRLLTRLNQVLTRVKLSPLPAKATSILEASRSIVRDRLSDLLPPEHYQFPIEST